MNHRLSLESIQHAMTTIPPEFLHTPQFEAAALSDALGCQITVKLETLNPIRSFKGRGASHFVASLELDAKLICASAGNFGQAMAYACRSRGIKLTVYAAHSANPLKLERMRALGAKVVLHGEDFDAAKLEAKRVAAQIGAFMVEDGLEPLISEGAGTMALELLRDRAFDALLIPLGNGAMLNGMARWSKACSSAGIVAVQASGAPAMLESWWAGRIVTHERMSTIADGIGVRVPIREALEDMKGLVNDGLTVSEQNILNAIKLIHQHIGVVSEPSGAVGVAALLEHPQRFAGQRVATVICGGNLTLEQMRAWL